MTLTFDGGVLKTAKADGVTVATFTLHPETNPKGIDLDMDGNLGLGIYKLKEDTPHLFGTAFAPWGPDWPAAYALFNGAHVVAALLLVALIAGHVAVALQHAWFDRELGLGRISPFAGPVRAAQR